MPNHILDKLRPPINLEKNNKTGWMLESNEFFTIRLTWQYIKQKGQPNEILKEI